MAKLNPYMHFKDNAREAMEFYKSVFGGELTMSTFREGANDTGPTADQIMHAMLVIGPEMTIMAADTPPHMDFTPGHSVEMSLSGEASNEEKLKGYWEGLSEGGEVSVPLGKSPWGDTFGMLKDKFGMEWMVNIAGIKE